MFFRKKQNTRKTPIKGEDGFYYIEEGVDYNSEEYETDSEYDSDEEYTNDLVECDDSSEVPPTDGDDADVSNSYNHSSNKENETEVLQSNTLKEEQVNDDRTNSAICPKPKEVVNEPEGIEIELEDEVESSSENPIRTTMIEKRSLVYLAAQQDRVDIIKAILQPSNDSDTSLIPLILNNEEGQSNYNRHDQNEEGEKVDRDLFLPPLHVAIASSSVNVATCLLRMGANPSIRPNIPEDWDGPDGCIDENGKPPFQGIDLQGLYNCKSAWEIAFPVPSEDSEKPPPSKGWFSSWSSSTSAEDKSNRVSIVDPSKLDGIRHAFTAETLRAIGSDEVKRLEELVDSGIGTRFTIAGKDILTWCMEMGANNCYAFLTSKFDSNGTVEEEVISESTTSTSTNTRRLSSSASPSNVVEEENIVFNNETLQMFRIKIEESESLNQALSVMRDNIADELSITEGILMQQNGHSNDILLSHVRMLKQKRADLDDEITEWESRIIDISYEVDMVLGWWTNTGGLVEDAFMNGESNSSVCHTQSQNHSDEEIKLKIEDAIEQFRSSQTKVKSLRGSIADMAIENSRNLAKVEELGLQGAVILARKLKDEIREQELVLRAAKMRASDLSYQVNQVRENLERKKNPELDRMDKEQSGDGATCEIAANSEDAMISNDGLNQESDGNHDVTSDCISDISPLNHNDSIVDSSNSSFESESSEESFETVPGRISHSDAIRQGLSTDMMPYQENERFFTTRVWDLIKRIIGLGKAAAQSAVDDVVNLPRVMVI